VVQDLGGYIVERGMEGKYLPPSGFMYKSWQGLLESTWKSWVTMLWSVKTKKGAKEVAKTANSPSTEHIMGRSPASEKLMLGWLCARRTSGNGIGITNIADQTSLMALKSLWSN